MSQDAVHVGVSKPSVRNRCVWTSWGDRGSHTIPTAAPGEGASESSMEDPSIPAVARGVHNGFGERRRIGSDSSKLASNASILTCRPLSEWARPETDEGTNVEGKKRATGAVARKATS